MPGWISNQLEAFSIPAYIILFIVLWIGICQLVSTVGGWSKLSRDYRVVAPFDTKKLRLDDSRYDPNVFKNN